MDRFECTKVGVMRLVDWDGKWVRYEDAQAEIARLTAERDAWKANAEALAASLSYYRRITKRMAFNEAVASDNALATHEALMKDSKVQPYILRLPMNQGVCIGGRYHGWLMRLHVDGHWVTVQKLPQEAPFDQGLSNIAGGAS